MLTFQGLTAARSRLALLAQGLQQIADGTVVDRAVGKVQAFVDKVAQAKIHHASGTAAGLVKVDANGATITLHGMPPANGERWSSKSYLSLHRWWPFRRGMPSFVVLFALRVLAAEILAVLGTRSGDLGALAGQVADEAAAAEAKKASRATRRAKA